MSTNFLFILFQLHNSLHCNSTFQALFLNLTAGFIWLANISVEQIRIGMTPTGAEKPRPAIPAFFLIQHMALTEILRPMLVSYPLIQGAKTIFFPAYKLMTRIQIPILRYRKIFMASPTARKSFSYTWAIGQIHIEVEEEEPLPLSPALQICLYQLIIFL